MTRGHAHGPKSVKLPHGFLADRDAIDELSAGAALAVSGG